MLKRRTKEESLGGFRKDTTRAGTLEFNVPKIKGVEFLYFRIGKTVAQRAGLQPKDRVELAFDPETGYGVLKAGPKGWALQSGDLKADVPPLVLRVTRQDDDPFIGHIAACTSVKAIENGLEFHFPPGTEFDGEVPEEMREIYKEHKEKIKKEKKSARKDEYRRKSDQAPMTRDGKPYGRRETDHMPLDYAKILRGKHN